MAASNGRPTVGPKGGTGVPPKIVPPQGGSGTAPTSSSQNEDGGSMSMREFGALMTNIMSRLDMIRGLQTDQRRDIYDSCRLPAVGAITPEMYWNMYDREAVAARVVEVLPKESWQVQPTIYESEDSDEVTEFEEAWDALGRQLLGEESWHADELANPLWEYLLRGDILSRVGQYGGILIGVADGRPLSEPADLTGGGNKELLYLRAFPQQYAKILEWDSDPGSRRYCKPIMYECTMNDPKSLTTVGSGTSAPVGSVEKVHWTRFVHLCDGAETLAPEKMRVVFNNLLGLQKLYCGSPEMYWRGAFPGIGFKTPSGLSPNVEIKKEDLAKMMEAYTEDLQRWFAVKNLEPQQFGPTVVDPTPQIMVQIQAICIILGVPMRVFMGSERGELASSQDDAAWNDRLRLRQNFYVTPRVIIPFVNRLIALGILPEPEEYHVYWPDLASQTQNEKADVAVKKMTSLTSFRNGNVEDMLSPVDFYVECWGKSEEEATQLIETAVEAFEEKQAEQIEQQAALLEDMASQPIPGIDDAEPGAEEQGGGSEEEEIGQEAI